VVQKIAKEYIQIIPFILVSHIQKYTKPNNIYLERQTYVIDYQEKQKDNKNKTR